jgi:hypothetical protein
VETSDPQHPHPTSPIEGEELNSAALHPTSPIEGEGRSADFRTVALESYPSLFVLFVSFVVQNEMRQLGKTSKSPMVSTRRKSFLQI